MKGQKRYWLVGIVAVVALLVPSTVRAQDEGGGSMPSRFSLGAGLGIPFGVIGIGCEVTPILSSGPDSIANYFSLNLGLGVAVAGVGYSLGFRLYPLGRDRVWAPKLSLLYGVVAVVDWKDIVRGFSVGGGVVRRLRGKLSLDADLIFIINHFGFDYIDWDSIGRLKVSLGLRWNFD